MNRKLKGNLILFLTAIIWGASFVSQSVSMDYIGPNTFSGIRTVMGGLVLLPVIFILDRKKDIAVKKQNKKDLIIGGVICGIFLCIASTLQTWGMKFTTAGKSGFVTALYIIFVPFFGIFMKKKIGILTYIGAFVAVLGMYLLCIHGSEMSINKGDLITVVCALFFTLQILAIDYYVDKVDGVKLACTQFLVSGTINLILMFAFEKPKMDEILSCWMPICYSGIFSCGIAYTLQIIGQKYTDPTPAAIIMSMESVFAAITGFIILNETMGVSEIIGCLIMFLAIVIVQLPDDTPKRMAKYLKK